MNRRTERDNQGKEVSARRAKLEMHFKGQPPILSGRALWSALGFPSNDAFRQARRRGSITVKLVSLEGRRGLFAYTVDVIDWLSTAAEHIDSGQSAALPASAGSTRRCEKGDTQ